MVFTEVDAFAAWHSRSNSTLSCLHSRARSSRTLASARMELTVSLCALPSDSRLASRASRHSTSASRKQPWRRQSTPRVLMARSVSRLRFPSCSRRRTSTWVERIEFTWPLQSTEYYVQLYRVLCLGL